MLEKKVLSTIEKYELIKYGDTIVIGVSGGPDSMTLLSVLQSLKESLGIQLIVAHINHGLRQEAIWEEEYVVSYCKANHIPCFVKKVQLEQIAKQQKIGTEEAGRKIRYQFFEEVAIKQQANKIATAHTLNDKVETVLLNMIRGCGISGLKGIEPIREQRYIRPLLEITRQQIEEYCKTHQLDPKIDKTNLENYYTRNKVRNLLIPYIQKEFNPNIIETLNRLSELAKEEEDYMKHITTMEYTKLLVKKEEKEIILDLIGFNALETVIKKRVLRYTINDLSKGEEEVSKVNIEDILKLCSRKIGNKYLKPNKKVKILVKNKKIFFMAD